MACTVKSNELSALQALLTSLAANDAHGNRDDLTPEQVRKLSERLGEIMGEVGLDTNENIGKRNEKGEVCLIIDEVR